MRQAPECFVTMQSSAQAGQGQRLTLRGPTALLGSVPPQALSVAHQLLSVMLKSMKTKLFRDQTMERHIIFAFLTSFLKHLACSSQPRRDCTNSATYGAR